MLCSIATRSKSESSRARSSRLRSSLKPMDSTNLRFTLPYYHVGILLGRCRSPRDHRACRSSESVRARFIDHSPLGLDPPQLDASPPRCPPADAPLVHALSPRPLGRELGPPPATRHAGLARASAHPACRPGVLDPAAAPLERLGRDPRHRPAGHVRALATVPGAGLCRECSQRSSHRVFIPQAAEPHVVARLSSRDVVRDVARPHPATSRSRGVG